jgi:hypothetical protein
MDPTCLPKYLKVFTLSSGIPFAVKVIFNARLESVCVCVCVCVYVCVYVYVYVYVCVVVNCFRPPVEGLSFSFNYGQVILRIQHKRLKLIPSKLAVITYSYRV